MPDRDNHLPEMAMVIAANLGYPRIGANRELKWAVESYWAGKITEDELTIASADIRASNWRYQYEQGIVHIPSNDFSLYDHVLDTALMVCLLYTSDAADE